MADLKLSDGAVTVTLREVQEERATHRVALDPLRDVTGDAVVYQRPDPLLEVPVSGRVLARGDLEQLIAWQTAESPIEVTSRDGVLTPGWRIKADPPLRGRRKDGDSPDWLVDLRLWRLA